MSNTQNKVNSMFLADYPLLPSQSPFQQCGYQLWERGYSVLPIMPETKIPGRFMDGAWHPMKNWTRYCKLRAVQEEIEEWLTDSTLCGDAQWRMLLKRRLLSKRGSTSQDRICNGLVTGQNIGQSSLTGAHVLDGFLNRILLISSNSFLPEKNHDAYSYHDVPEGIIEQIIAIDSMPTNAYDTPNSLASHWDNKPKVIKFEEGAASVLRGFSVMVDDQRRAMQQRGDANHAIWSRAAENCSNCAKW